ncbi:MAG TPA: UDP-N-acetylmuramoyl-tripeptide--D-alanyl-D-alanine ligase [Candidatus Binataceae bacterium]
MATPLPTNRCEMTLAEIAQATGGALFGDATRRIRGVSTDSRAIEPEGLFVALRGISHDGHAYIETAAARGAAAAVVGRGCGAPIDRVEVNDTLDALGRIASHHIRGFRARRSVPTIAIGGAVGKTTTKELTAAAARALFGHTLSTAGNLNNLIGVPLTLLGLEENHQAMVIECGTNSPGEIARLARIVEPDVAIVLNAEIEHTEGLGTREGVADEEAALFGGAREAIVTWAEDPLLIDRIPPNRMRTIFFGSSYRADVRMARRSVTAQGRSKVRIELRAGIIAPGIPAYVDLELRLLGPAGALNAAAAIAAVAALHPLRADQLAQLAAALGAVEPVPGRLVLKQAGSIRVLDDTYNANPSSVRVALETARELADQTGARMVVAMGDMLELGALSRELHIEAIEQAIAARPAALVVVGPEMTAAAAAQPGNAGLQPIAAPDSAAAAPIVRALLRAGDLLLVKGSRGIAMERVIEGL